MPKTNILIADDHSLIRHGVLFLLEDLEIDFNEHYASTLAQILDKVKSECIDFAVMDAHFPDGTGLKIIPEIKALQPELKILIYSGIDENPNALKYLNAGADGFVSKLSEEDEVKLAIESIIKSGKYLSPAVQNLLLNSLQNPGAYNPIAALTSREMEIAKMYAAGLGNLEIANRLNIKQNTVSTVKKRIFKKLKIETIVDLITAVKDA